MKEYHKINTIFKRDMAGDKKLIVGQWSQPEFEYLANNQWEFTEKVDGTNIRVHFSRGVFEGMPTVRINFGGRTDNASIPPDLLSALNKQFADLDLGTRVLNIMEERKIEEFTLYGEGYGPKIQRGGKYRSLPGFVMFDVAVGDWWLERDSVNDLGKTLDVDTVPVIGEGTLWDAIDLVKNGVDGDPPYLVSRWGNFEAEGIVARPAVSMFDRAGRRIIAKIKGKDFK